MEEDRVSHLTILLRGLCVSVVRVLVCKTKLVSATGPA